MAQTERTRIEEILRRLARMEDAGAPVISLYLNTARQEGRKREETRLFVKSRLRQVAALSQPGDPDLESLTADAELIQRAVEEALAPSTESEGQGLALFASHGRGLWERIPTPRPFENQLVVRRVPYLLQLARMFDDCGTAFLCQVDSKEARIFEFVLGGLMVESRFENPESPKRHHQGGWSQMRYQRHVDWQRERHVREVADVFVRLADSDGQARLFLSGPTETLAFLRAALPKRILDRGPVDLSLAKGAELNALVQTVLDGIDQREREEEDRQVRETVQEALAGGLAAAGPEDVAIASSQGAISRLLILAKQELRGWRCPGGCQVGAGEVPAACSVCGAGLVACDLAARLVERSLAGGAEVNVVQGHPLLQAAGGIAAQLRFRG